MEEKLIQLAKETGEYAIMLRRYFRMHPELGGEEVATQQKIMEELTNLGIPCRKAGGTGVLADISGGKPGRTVALRADIDALPLTDEIDKPYKSTISGRCHACGHDGHMAMLLGLAKIFQELKGELPGTIRLIFQPSEEKFPGGAELMIEAGALDGVDNILGAHLWQPVNSGDIGFTYGPMMAEPDEFKITVQGRGGHGSMPYQAVDPIYVGAQLVTLMKNIVANDLPAKEQAVLSFGSFQAGEVFNIIPDTSVLIGTVRSFSVPVRDKIFARMKTICDGVCTANGADYVMDIHYGFPPLINDPAVAAVVADSGRQALGAEYTKEIDPVMGAEDYSWYLQRIPGAFVFVGIGNEATGLVYPHHHPKFDIDESALSRGMAVLGLAASKLLHKAPK
ncbi:MAG TPA: amidohydrolase [Patescibacteria group bacterium]|nr:amidohydrolase [Patescibacteria group bacterium]